MNDERTAAIARGVEFLVARQADDGGWKQSRYGALRGGAATTAMILRALTSVGPAARLALRRPLRAAAEFLRRGLSRRGCIACPDGTLDLPVYATSLSLLAAHEDLPLWNDDERKQMVNWLRGQQLTERRGFAREDLQFGGWDLGAEPPPRGTTTGANLSLTSHALEALATFGDKLDSADAEDDSLRAAATLWLDRCQRLPVDGGFAFAPNTQFFEAKGGSDGTGRAASYESATCDGLLARVLCHTAQGAPLASDLVKAAVEWLATRPSVDDMRGDKTEEAASGATTWRRGLWFYYVARRVAVMNRLLDQLTPERLELEREWCRESLASLLEKQRKDGGWSNETAVMREDDPLLATPLALLALTGLD